jgi:putative tryptophan/tyrosine transport system substrate-binding protein
MKRREFIALVGAAASWPLTARANPIPRVGYIEGSRGTPWISDFLSALGDMGYVDGKNIIFVKRRTAAPTVQAMKDAISEIQPDIDLLVVGAQWVEWRPNQPQLTFPWSSFRSVRPWISG